MRKLHATLHRKWFDQIAIGEKREEYREIKPYWTKRLSVEYDTIVFRNGYNKNSPTMEVEFKGYRIKRVLDPTVNIKREVYAIQLGRVLWVKY